MPSNDLFGRYKALLVALKAIVKVSQSRVLSDDLDELFSENVNFFVKSYLISTCTYLEAYLQDLAFDLSQTICARLNAACLPHNFVYWRTAKEIKEKELKFENLNWSLSKKEVADDLSANPYKTIKIFKFLGVDLSQEEGFIENKDLVAAIVNKRNNIVHHNDVANDVSFSDVVSYIDVFISYMHAIKIAVYSADAGA
ncbi:MAG: HEPN domain-containing protein [Rhodanobacter sp.]|mgnify:FL=1|jgi:hypothetical protein|nr:hypothetical protein [Rhodanobacter sp.]